MDFNPGILQEHLNDDVSQGRYSRNQLAAISALQESLFKKWIPSDTSNLERVAIDGFKAANARCASYSTTSIPADLKERVKAMLWHYFHSGPYQTCILTLNESLALGCAGPGASRSTKHTDFFRKMFAGPLSTTSTLLYHHYKCGISARWQEAELARSRIYQVDVLKGSSLSTVPKNAKTNRTICTEPSLNMFYQRGAGEVINKVLLRHHNIDLSKQPKINQDLARRGSISGEFATIDLSSASDTISSALVEDLFPESVVHVLGLLRSPVTQLGDEEIKLHMWSSMGNGYTFPLQTLIFATLVRAVYEQLGIKPSCSSTPNYSVFGDDIICVSSAYDAVCQALEQFGFIVNSAKSYNEGPFRESCGQDFFEGYDIRGVYLRKIHGQTDLYSAFNRLARWSVKHNVYLLNVLRYLKGLADVRPVPYDCADTEGIKTPSNFAGELRSDGQGAQWYRALVQKSRYFRLKPDSYYLQFFHGALISAVGGYIREHKVGVRVTEPHFKVVRRRTPSWDYVTDAGLTIRDYQFLWSLL